MTATPSKDRPLPADIKLPERELLENGTMFVTLRTIDELQAFWKEHKSQFAYACKGTVVSDAVFLLQYEWVFGVTKAAVVQTVMRWGKSSVGCEFYDWASDDPGMHETWFLDRDSVRDDAIREGSWTDQRQAEYEADCARRSRTTYRGWWRLKDIPGDYDPDDWLQNYQEIIDPHLPLLEVERLLQEQTFDQWSEPELNDVSAYDAEQIAEELTRMKLEKARGYTPYYGQENEANLLPLPRPVATSVEYRAVSLDDEISMEAARQTETALASASPFSTLTSAIESIVSELDMILDDEIDGHVAEVTDAHNLAYLQDALDDATTALRQISALGVSGSDEDLGAFLAFSALVGKPTVEAIRESCDELDPQEYLDDYVIKVIADFDKLREAEEEFDIAAHQRQALPAMRAD